jgi:hypothetical protein
LLFISYTLSSSLLSLSSASGDSFSRHTSVPEQVISQEEGGKKMSARRSPRRIVGAATSLLFALSYFMAPARAALATTCYLELGSKLFIGPTDFACGVVNDTSVGSFFIR